MNTLMTNCGETLTVMELHTIRCIWNNDACHFKNITAMFTNIG